MDVLTAITGRRSIRAYKDIEVEEDKINKIIEAARLSPSAGNRQEWKFVIVRDKEARQKIAKASYNQSFIAEAPVVIAACATESMAVMPCGQKAYTVDLSIAVSYMLLQAYELGLGTCWIGAFKEKEVKAVLGVPEQVPVVALFPVGYPNQDPAPRPRKSAEQIVCFEKYQ